MKIERNGHWYCPYCNVEVDDTNVTFEELHDQCGNLVEFISKLDAGSEFNLLDKDIQTLKELQDKAFKYDAIQYVLRNGLFDQRKGGNFDVQLAIDVYESHLDSK